MEKFNVTTIIANFTKEKKITIQFKDIQSLTHTEIVEVLVDYVNNNAPDDTEVVLPITYTVANVKSLLPIDNEVAIKQLNAAQIKIQSKGEEEMEKETMFDQFNKMVEEATMIAQANAPKGFKATMNGKDNEVYDNLLNAVMEATMRFRKTGKLKESDAAEQVYDELSETVDNMTNKETTKEGKKKVLDRVKAIIAFVFRKTVALIKGTGLFVFDTTTILGTMVGRVAYHTVREVAFASKAIFRAFKTDVWDGVKQA